MKRLSIANFGPITSLEIEITPFLVFIGNQATGKSTVAKLIAIIDDLEFILSDKKDFKQKLLDYGLMNYLMPETNIEFVSEDYRFIYTRSNLIIELTDKLNERVRLERAATMEFLNHYVKRNNAELLDDERDKYINNLYRDNWINLFSMRIGYVYIPAERILMSQIRENPFTFFNTFKFSESISKFGSYFDLAKNTITPFHIDMFGVTLISEEGNPKISIKNNRVIDLHESASGFQAAIPMIAVVVEQSQKGNVSLIIEEPELCLFPKTQKEVIYYIFGLVNGNEHTKSKSIVITTHSPYLLSIFNNQLTAFKIGQKSNEISEKINEIIPSDYWINPDEFNAYYFVDGGVKSILNEDRLISENELDSISEDLSSDFNAMLEFL